MRTVDVRAPGIQSKIKLSSEPLGKGGEGSVYSVDGHSIPNLPNGSDIVAKIYHNPEDGDRRKKVVSMISVPPEADEALAWPIAMVADNGRFLGYVMKKLDSKNYRPWLEVAHSSTRRKKAPDFTVQYALYASRNLADALTTIHEAGHIVGDVNESNIFVSAQASVMIVDTDSAQIKSPKGEIFPCIVGKAEYTAPEISRGSLRDHVRTPETDAFAFGVAVFQILTGGAHPADGIYQINDDPPSVTEKIREGIFPGLGIGGKKFKPVPRIASIGIPSRILELLKSFLEVDPKRRISLTESLDVFDDVLENLQQCRKVKTHYYDRRDKKCGWCEHAKSQPDPWSNEKPKERKMAQKTLPGVSFKETKAPPKKAPRSKISTTASQGGGGYSAAPQRSFSPASQQGGTQTAPAPSSNLFAGANGGSGNGSHAAQQQGYHQPQQQGASIPEKMKGKMTVTYADGTYGPRPSMTALASAGRWKIIRDAIGVEYPSYLKFWWPQNRDAPNGFGLLIGLLLGLIAAYGWAPLTQLALDQWSTVDLVQLVAPIYGSIAMLTGAAFVALTLLFSTVSLAKMKVRGLRSESLLKTSIRFPLIGFIYGILPLALAAMLIIFALKAVSESFVRNT